MKKSGSCAVLGEHNFICDVCGFKYKSSQKRMRWDGFVVCPKDFEPRHPQDFLRGIPDRQTVQDARPDQVDQFVDYNEVTADSL